MNQRQLNVLLAQEHRLWLLASEGKLDAMEAWRNLMADSGHQMLMLLQERIKRIEWAVGQTCTQADGCVDPQACASYGIPGYCPLRSKG